MSSFAKRCFYRVFCILSLVALVYLAIDFHMHGRLDWKLSCLFLLFIVVIFWGLLDWMRNEQMIHSQEKELRTYQMYIQPLEELVKEIRARQHEFDNHMNAVLNMHITISDYDELVKKQSEYIKEVRLDDSRKYVNLLKISDKILAGFLYSKIVNAPENVHVQLNVENFEVISPVPEHDLIEVVGTLVDNAFEACREKGYEVCFVLDSQDDKLIFRTVNQVEEMCMEQVGRFFEKGYSTKGESRGLGLYNARQIAERFDGNITVSLDEKEGKQYLCVQIEI